MKVTRNKHRMVHSEWFDNPFRAEERAAELRQSGEYKMVRKTQSMNRRRIPAFAVRCYQ